MTLLSMLLSGLTVHTPAWKIGRESAAWLAITRVLLTAGGERQE